MVFLEGIPLACSNALVAVYTLGIKPIYFGACRDNYPVPFNYLINFLT